MKKKHPYAVVSLVMGIVSFIQLFGFEKAITAIVFGALALNQAKKEPISGKQLAYWGIALGIVYILILVYLVIFRGNQISEIFQMISK
ncbi:MAG: DUF4190 domain-containing protein [Elusimicrobiota bacterium]